MICTSREASDHRSSFSMGVALRRSRFKNSHNRSPSAPNNSLWVFFFELQSDVFSAAAALRLMRGAAKLHVLWNWLLAKSKTGFGELPLAHMPMPNRWWYVNYPQSSIQYSLCRARRQCWPKQVSDLVVLVWAACQWESKVLFTANFEMGCPESLDQSSRMRLPTHNIA